MRLVLIVLMLSAAMAPSFGEVGVSGLPETIDPEQLYLIYLHGKIVEDQGPGAVSETFGPYRYDAILQTFRDRGFQVVAEVRPRDTDPVEYAAHVVEQVNALRAAGVPASHITVVGASKGAGIAVYVSDRVGAEGVNTVLLAICGEQTLASFEQQAVCIRGNVLVIYDRADTIAGSCVKLFERCRDVLDEHHEIELDLGRGHGVLYAPLPEWIGPATSWARSHAEREPGRSRP